MFFKIERLLRREILGSCATVLDVGCGRASLIKRFSSKLEYSLGIDLYEPYLEESRAAGIHDHYERMNVLAIGGRFTEGSFDCVIACDLVEHLSKDDANRLIKMMERIARKKTIIYTPNGFVEQDEYDGNELQVHRSGWNVAELEDLGYEITGVGGWKSLRGERALIVRHPRPFWAGISLLSAPYVRRHPDRAFQLFCVKAV